jgi:hypothetical protein
MLYKAFAVITLIAAPIVVLIVQSVAPQPPSAAHPAPAAYQQPAPIISQPAPMPPSIEPAPDPAAFGQPMPEAGKPFLEPGNGLPPTAISAGETNDEEGAEASPEDTPS